MEHMTWHHPGCNWVLKGGRRNPLTGVGGAPCDCGYDDYLRSMDQKRVLVIDDLRTFISYPVTRYARTLDDGYHALLQDWDEIFLDHDLGGEDTIRPLVLHIAEVAHGGKLLPVKQFYVCSDNAPGRDWIIGTLERYYPVRFFQPEYRIT